MKKIILSAAISAAIAPLTSIAYAADPMSIVITASRYEQAQADTSTPVTVISKDDIQQQQPKSVAEAVALTPGLQVTSNGGYGQSSTLYLRGLSQKRMLILVDGVQIGSATLGEASLQHIPVDQIERIEIVRGARSSLYGSSAIAGVIQIFTKKPAQETNYAEIEAGIGSMNTQQASVSGGWSNSKSKVSANVSHFRTDGFDVMPDKASQGVDKDGYENTALKLDAEHKINQHTISAGLQVIDGKTDSDNCGPYGASDNNCESEIDYTTVYAGVDSQITESFSLNTTASVYQDSLQRFEQGEKASKFVTDTVSLGLQGHLALDNNITFINGFDYKKDDVSGSGVDGFKEKSRDNKAIFALLESNQQWSKTALSVRVDNNEAFGSFTTYGFENTINLSERISLSGNFAKAFKAPTFNDMYWPDSGNTELDPEESNTASLSANYADDNGLQLGLSLYQTEVDDMIAWAPTEQDPSKWQPSNINSVEIKGIELSAQASVGATHILFNADLMEPEDKSTGKVLIYRAQKTANLRITQQINKLTLGFDTQYTGTRYTDAANTDKLSAYTLLNIDGQYQINPQLQLSASVKNLTDKEYVSKKGYATADRTVFGSVRYRF